MENKLSKLYSITEIADYLSMSTSDVKKYVRKYDLGIISDSTLYSYETLKMLEIVSLFSMSSYYTLNMASHYIDIASHDEIDMEELPEDAKDTDYKVKNIIREIRRFRNSDGEVSTFKNSFKSFGIYLKPGLRH